MSSAEHWAGHCRCSVGAGVARLSGGTLHFAGSAPLSPREGLGGIPSLEQSVLWSILYLEQSCGKLSSRHKTLTILLYSPSQDTFPS